jgi:hypothetical protein
MRKMTAQQAATLAVTKERLVAFGIAPHLDALPDDPTSLACGACSAGPWEDCTPECVCPECTAFDWMVTS